MSDESDERIINPRRTIEQIKHCVEEALSCWEHDEDPRCILDDLTQANLLLEEVIKTKIIPLVRSGETISDCYR